MRTLPSGILPRKGRNLPFQSQCHQLVVGIMVLDGVDTVPVTIEGSEHGRILVSKLSKPEVRCCSCFRTLGLENSHAKSTSQCIDGLL
jgi:hypothetical protein